MDKDTPQGGAETPKPTGNFFGDRQRALSGEHTPEGDASDGAPTSPEHNLSLKDSLEQLNDAFGEAVSTLAGLKIKVGILDQLTSSGLTAQESSIRTSLMRFNLELDNEEDLAVIRKQCDDLISMVNEQQSLYELYRNGAADDVRLAADSAKPLLESPHLSEEMRKGLRKAISKAEMALPNFESGYITKDELETAISNANAAVVMCEDALQHQPAEATPEAEPTAEVEHGEPSDISPEDIPTFEKRLVDLQRECADKKEEARALIDIKDFLTRGQSDVLSGYLTSLNELLAQAGTEKSESAINAVRDKKFDLEDTIADYTELLSQRLDKEEESLTALREAVEKFITDSTLLEDEEKSELRNKIDTLSAVIDECRNNAETTDFAFITASKKAIEGRIEILRMTDLNRLDVASTPTFESAEEALASWSTRMDAVNSALQETKKTNLNSVDNQELSDILHTLRPVAVYVDNPSRVSDLTPEIQKPLEQIMLSTEARIQALLQKVAQGDTTKATPDKQPEGLTQVISPSPTTPNKQPTAEQWRAETTEKIEALRERLKAVNKDTLKDEPLDKYNQAQKLLVRARISLNNKITQELQQDTSSILSDAQGLIASLDGIAEKPADESLAAARKSIEDTEALHKERYANLSDQLQACLISLTGTNTTPENTALAEEADLLYTSISTDLEKYKTDKDVTLAETIKNNLIELRRKIKGIAKMQKQSAATPGNTGDMDNEKEPDASPDSLLTSFAFQSITRGVTDIKARNIRRATDNDLWEVLTDMDTNTWKEMSPELVSSWEPVYSTLKEYRAFIATHNNFATAFPFLVEDKDFLLSKLENGELEEAKEIATDIDQEIIKTKQEIEANKALLSEPYTVSNDDTEFRFIKQSPYFDNELVIISQKSGAIVPLTPEDTKCAEQAKTAIDLWKSLPDTERTRLTIRKNILLDTINRASFDKTLFAKAKSIADDFIAYMTTIASKASSPVAPSAAARGIPVTTSVDPAVAPTAPDLDTPEAQVHKSPKVERSVDDVFARNIRPNTTTSSWEIKRGGTWERMTDEEEQMYDAIYNILTAYKEFITSHANYKVSFPHLVEDKDYVLGLLEEGNLQEAHEFINIIGSGTIEAEMTIESNKRALNIGFIPSQDDDEHFQFIDTNDEGQLIILSKKSYTHVPLTEEDAFVVKRAIRAISLWANLDPVAKASCVKSKNALIDAVNQATFDKESFKTANTLAAEFITYIEGLSPAPATSTVTRATPTALTGSPSAAITKDPATPPLHNIPSFLRWITFENPRTKQTEGVWEIQNTKGEWAALPSEELKSNWGSIRFELQRYEEYERKMNALGKSLDPAIVDTKNSLLQTLSVREKPSRDDPTKTSLNIFYNNQPDADGKVRGIIWHDRLKELLDTANKRKASEIAVRGLEKDDSTNTWSLNGKRLTQREQAIWSNILRVDGGVLKNFSSFIRGNRMAYDMSLSVDPIATLIKAKGELIETLEAGKFEEAETLAKELSTTLQVAQEYRNQTQAKNLALVSTPIQYQVDSTRPQCIEKHRGENYVKIDKKTGDWVQMKQGEVEILENVYKNLNSFQNRKNTPAKSISDKNAILTLLDDYNFQGALEKSEAFVQEFGSVFAAEIPTLSSTVAPVMGSGVTPPGTSPDPAAPTGATPAGAPGSVGSPAVAPTTPDAPIILPGSEPIVRLGWPSNIVYQNNPKGLVGWFEIVGGKPIVLTGRVADWDALDEMFRGNQKSREQQLIPAYTRYLRFFETGVTAKERVEKREKYKDIIVKENEVVRAIEEKKPWEALTYCEILIDMLLAAEEEWAAHMKVEKDKKELDSVYKKQQEADEKVLVEREKPIKSNYESIRERAEATRAKLSSEGESAFIVRGLTKLAELFDPAVKLTGPLLADQAAALSLFEKELSGLEKKVAGSRYSGISKTAIDLELERLNELKRQELVGANNALLENKILSQAGRNQDILRRREEQAKQEWIDTYSKEAAQMLKASPQGSINFVNKYINKPLSEYLLGKIQRDAALQVMQDIWAFMTPDERAQVTPPRGLGEKDPIPAPYEATSLKNFRQTYSPSLDSVDKNDTIAGMPTQQFLNDLKPEERTRWELGNKVPENATPEQLAALRASGRLNNEAKYSKGMNDYNKGILAPGAIPLERDGGNGRIDPTLTAAPSPTPTPSAQPGSAQPSPEAAARRGAAVTSMLNTTISRAKGNWRALVMVGGIVLGSGIALLSDKEGAKGVEDKPEATATSPARQAVRSDVVPGGAPTANQATTGSPSTLSTLTLPNTWRGYMANLPNLKLNPQKFITDATKMNQNDLVKAYLPSIVTSANPSKITEILSLQPYEIMNNYEPNFAGLSDSQRREFGDFVNMIRASYDAAENAQARAAATVAGKNYTEENPGVAFPKVTLSQYIQDFKASMVKADRRDESRRS